MPNKGEVSWAGDCSRGRGTLRAYDRSAEVSLREDFGTITGLADVGCHVGDC